MNVVIYARYSSYKQTEQSIEGQLKECYAYAEREGFDVIGVYKDEAITGKSDDRPDFLRMIEYSKKKAFNGVIVYSLDRFSRDKYDNVRYKRELKKNNVRVFSAKENISDDPVGRLMENFFEGMAQYYSDELSEKVKRGIGINVSKFLYIGGYVTLGFKIVEIGRAHV